MRPLMMFFWTHPFRKLQQRGVVVTKRGDVTNCKDQDNFGGHFAKYDESGDIFACALAEGLGTYTCDKHKNSPLSGIIYEKSNNSVAKKAVERNFGK